VLLYFLEFLVLGRSAIQLGLRRLARSDPARQLANLFVLTRRVAKDATSTLVPS